MYHRFLEEGPSYAERLMDAYCHEYSETRQGRLAGLGMIAAWCKEGWHLR